MLAASLGLSCAVVAGRCEEGADAHAERGPPILAHTRVIFVDADREERSLLMCVCAFVRRFVAPL